MKWRTLTGAKIPDINEWILDQSRDGQEVHIGTDSLSMGRFTQFVTVVVIHTPMKGGRVAYSREVVPRMTSLRERLLKEVWKSVEVGIGLNPILPGNLNIHVDANPKEQYASNKYIQELVGLVMGQGFRVILKPDSWAACHTADWIVRHKGYRSDRSIRPSAKTDRSPSRAVHKRGAVADRADVSKRGSHEYPCKEPGCCFPA